MPTITRTLDIAPIACYLSNANVEKRKGLFGGLVDETNPKKIYNVYTILKHVYDQDPNYAGLQVRCDYLYELLKKWGVQAAGIFDGGAGGTVAPITPGTTISFDYLIHVTGGVPMFTNATDYDDARIIGHNIAVFWNDLPRFLLAGEWAYTPTGITILVGGFDATINNYDFYIFIYDPFGTSTTGAEVTRGFQYTGIGGETSFFDSLLQDSTIISVTRSTPYTIINSGIPTGLEALVTLSGSLSDGHISFAADNPIIAGEIVTVIFSKAT